MTTNENTQLNKIIQVAQALPGLAKVRPQGDNWEVSLKFVKSDEMIRLNHVYRNKSQVTDILSFPAAEPFWNKGFLGDLVICLPVLKQQAKEMRHSTQTELKVLLVHGLLHLLGFDHEVSAKEAKIMARWESKILNLLNDQNQKLGQKLSLINRSYPV